MGVAKDALAAVGGSLSDGSVILTDLRSFQTHTPKGFAVNINGHLFSGSYEGVFAIKASKEGTIEKLACGECGPLSRNERRLLSLTRAAGVVLIRHSRDNHTAIVKDVTGSNSIQLVQ